MDAVRYGEVLDDLRSAYDAQVAARERMPLAPWKEPLRARFLERLRAEGRRSLVELGAGPGIHGRYFQGVRPRDPYVPKRYFSFLPDAALRSLAEVDFDLLDFEVVELPDPEEPGFHVQALTLRRR